MFILIPVTLILVSVAGISILVFRKMPYLNKLTPETHAGGDILNDLFPELSDGLKSLKLREYGNLWFIELEKFLRKLRLFFLRIDRMSDAWIKKIRSGNISRATNLVEEKEGLPEVPVLKTHPAPVITMEDMKKEEQGLIIEIAKNPKNSSLYEALGDLYLKMNNLSDAKESFEAAVELNPNSEALKQKLSSVLRKTNALN